MRGVLDDRFLRRVAGDPKYRRRAKFREAMGGAFCRMRGEIEDTQFGRNVAALKTELDKEEAERDQITGEAKAKIQAKLMPPGRSFKPCRMASRQGSIPASKRWKQRSSPCRSRQPRHVANGKPSSRRAALRSRQNTRVPFEARAGSDAYPRSPGLLSKLADSTL